MVSSTGLASQSDTHVVQSLSKYGQATMAHPMKLGRLIATRYERLLSELRSGGRKHFIPKVCDVEHDGPLHAENARPNQMVRDAIGDYLTRSSITDACGGEEANGTNVRASGRPTANANNDYRVA